MGHIRTAIITGKNTEGCVLVLLLLRGSEIDSAYCEIFLRSAVCLSVVCHIRAPCLNRSVDLDVIWQVHFRFNGDI